MSYTEDQIKQYLDILHNYNKLREEISKNLNVVIVKILIVLVLFLVTKFVMNVQQQTGIY